MFLIAVALTLVWPSFASEPDALRVIDLLGSEKPLASGERQLVASWLLKEMQVLNREIPNLSPDQVEWLAKEREEIGNDVSRRLFDLEDSKEYSIEYTKFRLQEIIKFFRAITSAQKLSIKSEIQQWAGVYYYMSDVYFAEHIDRFKAEKILGNKSFIVFDSTNALNSHSRQILKLIIIPYLMDELPE